MTNILIIKLGAMGDVLRTTSILQGLRKKYKAKIYWITKKDSIPLLFNNPYLKKIFPYNQNSLNYLRTLSFDIVINLDEDLEACSLATNLQKRKLYGFYLNKNQQITPTPTATEWFNMGALGNKPKNDLLKKKNKKTHQKIMHEIVELPYENPDTLVHLTRRQLLFAKNFKRRYNIKPNDLVIGLNTGSGDRWPKQLSIEKTAILAENLYKKYKAKIILFGGENELERNNSIISLANIPLINSGCGNNLFEFPALINLCHLFITSDSLGMHIALGLKRKTLAFFGPTSAAEIEMYGLGEKIISKSYCYCCYKANCKAIEDISVEDIEKKIEKFIQVPSISIVITSFKEPLVGKAIESFVKQDIHYPYELIVVDPDDETKELVDNLSKRFPQVKYFKDPGKGKSFALNLIFKETKSDFLILTDGDVYVSQTSVNELMKLFRNPLIGVVTGRVISSNKKNNMLGYWSHLLADAGAHKIRSDLYRQGRFLECSAYLLAYRNHIVKEIPLDVAEDAYIPYIFWQKGYKVGYAEKAGVFVKNPINFKDWLKQRTRTSKAHETLDKYVDTDLVPRVKSFSNEIKKGFTRSLQYPKNLKEYYWTFVLMAARFYMWTKVFFDTKIKEKHYQDAWEKVESTKT
jgi:ADP-heptose:LPS heptosyltransferase